MKAMKVSSGGSNGNGKIGKQHSNGIFFIKEYVVREPVNNGSCYSGRFVQAIRDDYGEFGGCMNFGVLRKE